MRVCVCFLPLTLLYQTGKDRFCSVFQGEKLWITGVQFYPGKEQENLRSSCFHLSNISKHTCVQWERKESCFHFTILPAQGARAAMAGEWLQVFHCLWLCFGGLTAQKEGWGKGAEPWKGHPADRTVLLWDVGDGSLGRRNDYANTQSSTLINMLQLLGGKIGKSKIIWICVLKSFLWF